MDGSIEYNECRMTKANTINKNIWTNEYYIRLKTRKKNQIEASSEEGMNIK